MPRLASLLAHAFHRDDQLNILRRRAKIFLDIEVFQLQFGAAFEASTVAAPWVLAFADKLGGNHHRLGHAVEGKVASNVGSAFTGGFDRG